MLIVQRVVRDAGVLASDKQVQANDEPQELQLPEGISPSRYSTVGVGVKIRLRSSEELTETE